MDPLSLGNLAVLILAAIGFACGYLIFLLVIVRVLSWTSDPFDEIEDAYSIDEKPREEAQPRAI
jgi:hypothetical protein